MVSVGFRTPGLILRAGRDPAANGQLLYVDVNASTNLLANPAAGSFLFHFFILETSASTIP